MTHPDDSALDAAAVERATGWHVVARRSVRSTNDEAAAMRDRGEADDRVAVVADEQTAGRGRGGHMFSSPVGGLYVSLLVRVPLADLPAPLVFATAVALAEAIEDVAGVETRIKWPNDVWVEGKKAAGILVESGGARAGDDKPAASAVVGVGVNLHAVPADLEADVAAVTTALDRHTSKPVAREALLARIVAHFDDWRARLGDPAGRRSLEAEYRRRLALVGQPVRFFVGDAERRGVLRDASLERGVRIDESAGTSSPAGESTAARWWPAEHVRELRSDPPQSTAAPTRRWGFFVQTALIALFAAFLVAETSGLLGLLVVGLVVALACVVPRTKKHSPRA